MFWNNKVCTLNKKFEPELFSSFVKKNFTKKKISFGVWDSTSFSTEVYKLKRKRCSECFEYSMLGICPISPAPKSEDSSTTISIYQENLIACGMQYTHRIEIGKCKVTF